MTDGVLLVDVMLAVLFATPHEERQDNGDIESMWGSRPQGLADAIKKWLGEISRRCSPLMLKAPHCAGLAGETSVEPVLGNKKSYQQLPYRREDASFYTESR